MFSAAATAAAAAASKSSTVLESRVAYHKEILPLLLFQW